MGGDMTTEAAWQLQEELLAGDQVALAAFRKDQLMWRQLAKETKKAEAVVRELQQTGKVTTGKMEEPFDV